MAQRNPKAKKIRIRINREMCKGCGICIAFCPKAVFELNHDEKAVATHVEKCNACGLCELRCPDMAVEMKKTKNHPQNKKDRQSL